MTRCGLQRDFQNISSKSYNECEGSRFVLEMRNRIYIKDEADLYDAMH